MNLKNEKDWNEDDYSMYEDALNKAEHGRCVEISTQSAIKEMVLPGILAISTPVVVGFAQNYLAVTKARKYLAACWLV